VGVNVVGNLLWLPTPTECDRMPSTTHIDELLDERSATMVLSTTVAGGCMAQTTTQLSATNRVRNCAR